MSERESVRAGRHMPVTRVTLTLYIDHPEWEGDGEDEKIALDNLRYAVGEYRLTDIAAETFRPDGGPL